MANIFHVERTDNKITLGTGATSIYLTPMTQGSLLFAGASGLLSQDNSDLFWDDTNKRLGLGTATPAQKLEISHTSWVKLQMSNTGDSVYGQIVVGAGAASGFWVQSASAHPLFFATNGGDAQITLNTDGKVGIGLVTPKTLLTVEGTLTLKEQAAADGDTAAYGQIWAKSDTPNTLWFTDDSGGNYAISPKTLTITASADDTNVLGINTVFINPASANVVIGGLTGGIAGQVLCVAITGIAFTTTLENQEGIGGSQDIYLCDESDDILDDYGGWTLICDGTNWYDCGHAKHV